MREERLRMARGEGRRNERNDGGKRSFGAGGVGETSNSVAKERGQEESPGQARRADAAPYGIDMEPGGSYRGGGEVVQGGPMDDAADAGAKRSVWRRNSPERTPRPTAAAGDAAVGLYNL
jgi:hypothetical protein